MNWQDKLNDFDRAILEQLGASWLPYDCNPIIRALEQGDFVARFQDVPGFGKASVSRLASICQMEVYDNSDGPDGDGKRKGLRRQWYAWFKTRFAQPFAVQLAENGDEHEQKGFDGTGWAARLSTVYAGLVDDENVTYWDLWVDDASRMTERFWDSLFRGCNIIIAVEKDSLFADFKAAAHALGAKTVLSGKGKMSKAATEKVLREHFSWRDGYDPFSKDEPLIVLHISDHDFDGEAVIGPTFGEQARRYTEFVLEARAGIKPESVDDWEADWYDVKVSNKGYINWAQREGLFLADCTCGHSWPVYGEWDREKVTMYRVPSNELDDHPEELRSLIGHSCPKCRRDVILTIKIDGTVVNQPHGFEVEALPTRNYYRMLVGALLQVIPFDYIVGKLRDECAASARDAAEQIKSEILDSNESYQSLLREFDRLEDIKREFEDRIANEMESLGEPYINDWRDDDPDPAPEDFGNHVHNAQDWTGPWRPFRRSDRTAKLVDHLRSSYAGTIDNFKSEVIEW